MGKPARLSYQWIHDGFLKLSSQCNVVIFETEDPARYRQLIRFLAGNPSFREHSLYQYDPWRGLTQGRAGSESFTPVAVGSGNRFTVQTAQELGAEDTLRDLNAALRHIDRELRRRPCLFIIKDMEALQSQGMDRQPALLHALRSWVLDDAVRRQRSAVICLAADPGSFADSHTLQRLAIVPVELANDTERAYMIQQVAVEINQVESTLSQINQLVPATAGLNLHQLASILREAYHRCGSIQVERVTQLKSQRINQEGLLEVLEPNQGFSSIGGYEKVKDFIRSAIISQLARPEQAAYYGTQLPKGILLWGPPGTGKSLFARALAAEIRLPFIQIPMENLYTAELGGSGRLIRQARNIIDSNSPCLVFIDEIDQLGSRRGAVHDSAGEETRRVLNQILIWFADPNRDCIVVGATNRPQDLDEAFVRPGRLDYKIPILYPDSEAREAILKIHLGMTGSCPRVPLSAQDLQIIDKIVSWLAEATPYFSGAELEQLTQRIRRNASQRNSPYATQTDFIEALKSFNVDRESRAMDVQAYLEFARIHLGDHSFVDPLLEGMR